jgi:hypothetical protein
MTRSPLHLQHCIGFQPEQWYLRHTYLLLMVNKQYDFISLKIPITKSFRQRWSRLSQIRPQIYVNKIWNDRICYEMAFLK